MRDIRLETRGLRFSFITLSPNRRLRKQKTKVIRHLGSPITVHYIQVTKDLGNLDSKRKGQGPLLGDYQMLII